MTRQDIRDKYKEHTGKEYSEPVNLDVKKYITYIEGMALFAYSQLEKTVKLIKE